MRKKQKCEKEKSEENAEDGWKRERRVEKIGENNVIEGDISGKKKEIIVGKNERKIKY